MVTYFGESMRDCSFCLPSSSYLYTWYHQRFSVPHHKKQKKFSVNEEIMGICNNPQIFVTHFVQPSTCRLKHHLQVCNLLISLTLHKLSCDSVSNNLFSYNLSFLTSFRQLSFFWLEICNWLLWKLSTRHLEHMPHYLKSGCVRFKATRGMEPRLSCEADWKQTFGMSVEGCADDKCPSRWVSYSTCDTISKELTLCLCPRFSQKSETHFCTDFWKWGKEIS